jgi:aerobic carbon-monoxide dehydrogenase large subunit
VADLAFPRMLHAAFVRSPVAHARIRAVDLSRAKTMPGVVVSLSGAELMRLLPPVSDSQLSLPAKWRATVRHKLHNPQQRLLAADKVRHVGEAIAVIVADYIAEDAAELVSVDLETLPAVVDAEQAVKPGAPIVHEQLPSNVIGEFAIAKSDVEAALVRAPHKLKRRFYHHRYSGVPLECRGVVGVYDQRTDCVTIWSPTQVVHWLRREASTVLDLPEGRVRVPRRPPALAAESNSGAGERRRSPVREANPSVRRGGVRDVRAGNPTDHRSPPSSRSSRPE